MQKTRSFFLSHCSKFTFYTLNVILCCSCSSLHVHFSTDATAFCSTVTSSFVRVFRQDPRVNGQTGRILPIQISPNHHPLPSFNIRSLRLIIFHFSDTELWTIFILKLLRTVIERSKKILNIVNMMKCNINQVNEYCCKLL